MDTTSYHNGYSRYQLIEMLSVLRRHAPVAVIAMLRDAYQTEVTGLSLGALSPWYIHKWETMQSNLNHLAWMHLAVKAKYGDLLYRERGPSKEDLDWMYSIDGGLPVDPQLAFTHKHAKDVQSTLETIRRTFDTPTGYWWDTLQRLLFRARKGGTHDHH